jgi:hypothetical protein
LKVHVDQLHGPPLKAQEVPPLDVPKPTITIHTRQYYAQDCQELTLDFDHKGALKIPPNHHHMEVLGSTCEARKVSGMKCSGMLETNAKVE